ncbi:MAG: bifunctional folylpolyglutamate synthase/dihydrofolate synthase, partial [Bacteroides sp.]|nr:bifunctional folylpolyglutamate synthase/dihydrofolate synthase [Bacteroides sp.]
ARAAGLRGEAYPTVAAAYAAARSTGHTIFVGGSNFVVADLLSLFSRLKSHISQ